MKRFSKPIHLPEIVTGPKRDSSLALINVVFLLLVFLLVAGSLRPPLPQEFEWAETTAEDEAEGAIQGSLALDKNGTVWDGTNLLEATELSNRLTSLAGAGGSLTLQVDRRTSIRSLNVIADQARKAGLKKLTLITVEAADQ